MMGRETHLFEIHFDVRRPSLVLDESWLVLKLLLLLAQNPNERLIGKAIPCFLGDDLVVGGLW
jgi:hypothetical protein